MKAFPSADEVEAFWDMIQGSIKTFYGLLDEVLAMEKNNWQVPEPEVKKEAEMKPPASQKPKKKKKAPIVKGRSGFAEFIKKQREAEKKQALETGSASVDSGIAISVGSGTNVCNTEITVITEKVEIPEIVEETEIAEMDSTCSDIVLEKKEVRVESDCSSGEMPYNL